jgi:hypothetical protein
MQTLQREQAYDRYLEVPDMAEWSDSDIKEATDAYIDDVMFNNAQWDDDGGYIQDFGIEVERIMRYESRDEWTSLISEAYAKRVRDYCIGVVRNNPDFYCAKYCD